MSVSVDVAWKSLNKHNEELCGDKVELLKTEDSDIAILADGMGSGVKANILATLTSKILRTMFLNGAPIEDAVETIANTLPVCKEREVAYSTFSVLQIFHTGEAYLVEFDNPSCVFIRNKKIVDIPFETRIIEGKTIREYRFHVKINDCFVLMSDGVIYAGAGELLNLGWTWESMADYTLKCTKDTLSAKRLCAMLSQACDDLYMQEPGDDTTICVTRVIDRKVLQIFTGPPKSKELDDALMNDFLSGEGKHIVCGGTSSNIAARFLDKEIETELSSASADVPPTARIEGLDLVTEGVLTLSKTIQMLKQYLSDDVDVDFFLSLDEDNGASRLAKLLIEECTDLYLFVGTAMNEAHQSPNLPFDLSIRMNLVEQLKEAVQKMGKNVIVRYY
jgi:hypothetical protein